MEYGDLISRQSAIDAIEAYFGDLPIMGHYDMLQLIKKLPSVQPRKSGTWLIIGKTGLAACECGYITNRYYEYNFCPSCGTPMKKEHDVRRE